MLKTYVSTIQYSIRMFLFRNHKLERPGNLRCVNQNSAIKFAIKRFLSGLLQRPFWEENRTVFGVNFCIPSNKGHRKR